MPIDDYLEKLEVEPKFNLNSSRDEFMVLPADKNYRELMIAINRSSKQFTWYEAHEYLEQEKCFMISPDQFKKALNYIKTGNVYDEHGNYFSKRNLRRIWNDLVGLHGAPRVEWLNLFSKNTFGGWVLGTKPCLKLTLYNRINEKGGLTDIKVAFANDDEFNNSCYFNLRDYLRDNNSIVPQKAISTGNHKYFKPKCFCATQFRAGRSENCGLYCNVDLENLANIRKAKWRG